MNFQAIIFDMDGTIIDSGQLWHRANVHILEYYHVTICCHKKKELSNRLNGQSFIECCKIIREVGNIEDDLTTVMERKLKIVSELFTTQVKFVEGFISFHDKARSYNLKTAIATNASDHILTLTKQLLDLERFFAHHTYGVDHVNGKAKPDPTLYLHAAQQLRVVPQQCIAIEDSPVGIAAAKSAGTFCIGINTARNPDHIQHADLRVNHYYEIALEQLLGLSN